MPSWSQRITGIFEKVNFNNKKIFGIIVENIFEKHHQTSVIRIKNLFSTTFGTLQMCEYLPPVCEFNTIAIGAKYSWNVTIRYCMGGIQKIVEQYNIVVQTIR